MVARKKAASTVTVPAITRKRLYLRLVGLSALVAHAWSEKAIRMMREKQQKKATNKKEAKDPKADFNAARYRMHGGADGVRADGIKKAMVDACSFVDGVTKVLARGAFYVNLGSNLVPIQFRKDDGTYGTYGIDREPEMREDLVRVGGKGPGTGTADLRYRPEYEGWSVPVAVEYDDSVISADQVVNLLKRAGFSIGVGEGRPQLQGGQWGMFDVVADEAMLPVAEAAE